VDVKGEKFLTYMWAFILTYMQPQQQFSVDFVIVLVCCCTHKQKPATGNSLEKQLNVASAMKLENCNKNLCTGDKQNKNKVCGFSGRVSSDGG